MFIYYFTKCYKLIIWRAVTGFYRNAILHLNPHKSEKTDDNISRTAASPPPPRKKILCANLNCVIHYGGIASTLNALILPCILSKIDWHNSVKSTKGNLNNPRNRYLHFPVLGGDLAGGPASYSTGQLLQHRHGPAALLRPSKL